MTEEKKFQARRSFIFAPGYQPEMYPKALKTGADIVCIDLEDAIAPQHKDISRERTMALFAEAQADDGVERMVRTIAPGRRKVWPTCKRLLPDRIARQRSCCRK